MLAGKGVRNQRSLLEARLLPCPHLWLPPRSQTLAYPSGWNSQPGCSTLRGRLYGAPSAISPLRCFWRVTRPQGPNMMCTGEKEAGLQLHTQEVACCQPTCLDPTAQRVGRTGLRSGPPCTRGRGSVRGTGWRGFAWDCVVCGALRTGSLR